MTERQNIRRMQTLEPGRHRESFDPERDITPSDWQEIQAACDKIIGSPDSGERMQAPYYLRSLSILRPDHSSLKNADGSAITLRIDHARSSHDWRRFLVSACTNALLGHKVMVDPFDRNDINQYIDALRGGGVDDSLALALANAHIADPKHTFPLGQNDEKQMSERLQVNRDHLAMVDYAMDIAANMRILGLTFSPFKTDEWRSASDILEGHRMNENWKEFLVLAAAMKILTAEKIEVPPHGGLKITMPKSKVEDATKVPPQPEALGLQE